MNLSGKYQPYKGYGKGKPWYWYGRWRNGVPRRVKTRGDWVWAYSKSYHRVEWCHYWIVRDGPDEQFCNQCGFVHCMHCGCNRFWKKWVDTGASTFEKRKLHRDFRRQAKALIRRELDGEEDISHNFYVSGDWLD